MSTLKQQHVADIALTEDSIADYLQANPEFFERHSALLNSLRLPHDAGGPAVSLVERQVLVLRQKNLKLERKLKDELATWCRELKSALGCGGAVEGDAIMLQGDLRARLPDLLTARGVAKVTVG